MNVGSNPTRDFKEGEPSRRGARLESVAAAKRLGFEFSAFRSRRVSGWTRSFVASEVRITHRSGFESLALRLTRPEARSDAEALAVKQRNIQIALVATNVLVSTLIALKTFGLI